MTPVGGDGPGDGEIQWPSTPANSPGWGDRTPPAPSPWPAPPEANRPAGSPPGQGNIGQGNIGQGNIGQANTGQGSTGQAPMSPVPVPAGTGTAGAEPEALGPNTRCYEHPDRLASSICRSCNRPICTVCMVQAPVGWHCHQCVRRDAKKSPVVRYQPGAAGFPAARQTPVTIALIVINLILFAAAAASDTLTANTWVYPILMRNGGQLYRLFTSFFVTNSFLDVALNMWCLLIIGRLIEPALGKWRYLALYLLSGLGGSVAYYLLGNPLQPAAGASGAIFGIFGAYFILARRSSANTSGIVALIGINLVFSFVIPNIAWQAHIGGLITGLAVASGFALARGRRDELVADVLVVAAVGVALGLLMFLPPGVINLG
jgi:membrane associated rhomboid family serine protease